MARSELSGVDPAFRRIAEALRGQIVRGEIEAGQRLPAIRAKAKELGVSSDTVYKAYELLKTEGMLVSRMGSAVMVSGSIPGRHKTEFLSKTIDRGPTSHYESVSASSPVRSLATNVGDPHLFPADEFLADLGELRRSSPS
ncbi:MAG: GntR family transcriptional regulator, partial [Armatimonadota bacterium]